MARVKMSKVDKKIKHLEGLLERRQREITAIQRRADEEIAKVKRRNAFTNFQIDSLRKGEWPL
jgi:dynactin complex subunit